MADTLSDIVVGGDKTQDIPLSSQDLGEVEKQAIEEQKIELPEIQQAESSDILTSEPEIQIQSRPELIEVPESDLESFKSFDSQFANRQDLNKFQQFDQNFNSNLKDSIPTPQTENQNLNEVDVSIFNKEKEPSESELSRFQTNWDLSNTRILKRMFKGLGTGIDAVKFASSRVGQVLANLPPEEYEKQFSKIEKMTDDQIDVLEGYESYLQSLPSYQQISNTANQKLKDKVFDKNYWGDTLTQLVPEISMFVGSGLLGKVAKVGRTAGIGAYAIWTNLGDATETVENIEKKIGGPMNPVTKLMMLVGKTSFNTLLDTMLMTRVINPSKNIPQIFKAAFVDTFKQGSFKSGIKTLNKIFVDEGAGLLGKKLFRDLLYRGAQDGSLALFQIVANDFADELGAGEKIDKDFLKKTLVELPDKALPILSLIFGSQLLHSGSTKVARAKKAIKVKTSRQVKSKVSEGLKAREQAKATSTIKIEEKPELKIVGKPSKKKTQDKLPEEIEKVAKSVDDYIDDALPQPGLSLKEIGKETKLVDDVVKFPKKQTLGSLDAEVESRWQSAKGLKKAPLYEGVKAAAKRLKDSFTRKNIYLDPKNSVDAQVNEILRAYDNIAEYSKFSAHQVLKGITGKFGKNKMDVFSRNIILEDLVQDVDKGLYKYTDEVSSKFKEKDLPFGYKNVNDLKADLEKYKKILNENPDIKEAVDKRNSFMKTLKKDLVKNKLLPKEVLKHEQYFHHMVLQQMQIDANRKPGVSPAKDVRLRKKDWQKRRKGSAKDFNTEYLESEFKVISQGISQLKVKQTLDLINKTANIAPELKKNAKELGVKDWKQLIPEGYVAYDLNKIPRLFQANTITDQVLDEVLTLGRSLDENDIRQVLALGAKDQWIIPENIAKTLENFRTFPDDAGLSQLSKSAVSTWKQWTLLNPFRVLKYNINNTSGDLDIAIAHDPAIIKEIPGAMKDLYKNYKGKGASKDILTMLEKGVIGSGISINEIPDITKQGAFQLITSENPTLIQKYWSKTKDFTNYRENIIRVAAYRKILKDLKAGKDVGYISSKKSEIDALDKGIQEGIFTIEDKAAKLSRELIGDYGNVSKAGQYIRERISPFYSWMEINAPRYIRLMQNSLRGESDLKRVGRVSGIIGKKGLIKGTKTLAKANGLMMLVHLWNKTFFPQEEAELSEWGRKQLHLILPYKTPDGKQMTIRFQGAFSDFLDWVALGNVPHDTAQFLKDELTVGDKLKEMVTAPLNKVFHSLRPDVKLLYEVPMKQTLFPDPLDPRPVRDRGEHIAKTLSVDPIYRWIAGKPTKSMTQELAKILVYTSDPKEAAYYTMRSKVYDWLDAKGEDKGKFIPGKKANALYYYKQALRYGDEKASRKYLKQYRDLGGNLKGLNSSIKKEHPLGALTKKDRLDFIKSLTSKDSAAMEKAVEYYNETFLQTKEKNNG